MARISGSNRYVFPTSVGAAALARAVRLLAVLSVLACIPQPLSALPQFARRYNLKCFACHTIPPVLNEQGYMFKRLGFHLPPSLAKGQRAPTMSYLVESEKQWSVTDNVAFAVSDFSYQLQRSTQEGSSPSSVSGAQVGALNSFFAGWIPDTNFFYFSEFDIVANGSTSPEVAQAYIGYSGGSARSSWFVAGGRELRQTAEGTRAAQVFSLLPESPLLFETAGPTNYLLDQSPMGVSAGYTWASSSYRNVLAISAKVTNGVNADGSEVLGLTSRQSRDVWVDADWWYAPESGVTFLDYYGTKDQTQNAGLDNEFTYRAKIRRQGVFANYMLRYKVDFLGGYLRTRDDWQDPNLGPNGLFKGNDFFGEVDAYPIRGLAISARYDRLNQRVTGGPGQTHTYDWTAAVNKALTPSGNIVARIGYSYLSGRDPLAAVKSTDRLIMADVMFNF
jgi:hypothetical protein